ncbi:MAG: serine/threonine protein kinase [Watsoniomyces obsoletus]|nr:MAG: serine/threonine protein kinase [Watsoniomyces obsoletus]
MAWNLQLKDATATWHAVRIPILLVILAIFCASRVLFYIRNKNISRVSSRGGPILPVKKSQDVQWVETPPNKSRPPLKPKRVVGKKLVTRKPSNRAPIVNTSGSPSKIEVLVFYASITGRTEISAKRFVEQLSSSLLPSNDDNDTTFTIRLFDLSQIDYDEYFTSLPTISDQPDSSYFYLFLIPSYDIDTILDTFLGHLQDTHYDFRVDKAPLRGLLGYSVFGFGDREGWPTEESGFCGQAKQLDKWLARLSQGRRAFPLGFGDVKSDDGDFKMEEWREGITQVILGLKEHGGSLGEGVVGSGDAIESDEEEEDEAIPKKNAVDDMEEIGRSSSVTTIKSTTTSSTTKEMVPKSSPTYTALTKQGYTIIGSHSGVKICRWTKSALRGRGSCYKYSFYGIRSHLCMETTPSLSCSNKCVFCWRHGTNPVGTTWRWTIDPPDLILQGAKQGHYQKIRMMRGVPGIRADRFSEAFRIRHCALSLVGEPIFYPRINELVDLLHAERISTFVVCNAQHPTQLRALKRVTQLYVSIDASNRESLKRIDRPLHRDFWERFTECLDILREKRWFQRTVFRLTLVKGFNVEDEVQGYADLVMRGRPCFVEIKGVTFCGTSSSSSMGLSMTNVPFHEEVKEFAEGLNRALKERFDAITESDEDDQGRRMGGEEGMDEMEEEMGKEGYGIAAEHAHSCCILLASNRFLIKGKWHTRINYDRFFDLLETENENGTRKKSNENGVDYENEEDECGRTSVGAEKEEMKKKEKEGMEKRFKPEDYIDDNPTPDWALYGNGGFDPVDTRVYTKGSKKKKMNQLEQMEQIEQEQLEQ